jgi:hypothetical protein
VLSFRNVSVGKPRAPIYLGNTEGSKLPYGYVAKKTNPGALASGQEGTEEKSSLFREI